MADQIRLTNRRTGVVVNVDPGTRAVLDREWIEEGEELEEWLNELGNDDDEPSGDDGSDEPDGSHESDGSDGSDESDESDESTQPPAGNATRDEWAKFAAGLGIVVEDTTKRDEIRAQVEQLLDDAGDESGE
ncbi:hypothetical protein [Microbacterium sp. B19(2022)]|uniref:hypothetical protein n=1 Tax=Microbacterium sp. B19(2022) TaxID=2914045 RepID=UPI00197B751B|nr:hypothetical protein [Microbacterium sp. B19(2022)]